MMTTTRLKATARLMEGLSEDRSKKGRGRRKVERKGEQKRGMTGPTRIEGTREEEQEIET